MLSFFIFLCKGVISLSENNNFNSKLLFFVCNTMDVITNKQRYETLCREQGSAIPLFLQYWWMETVCYGKEWDVILVERNKQIVAAMPYHIGRKLGMKYIIQPQLTQYNGIWYRPQEWASENKRLSFEKWAASKVVHSLKQLNLAYYQQNFSPVITNWLPFYWNGFKQTTRYTYRINDLSNSDKVYAAFDKDDRRKPIEKIADKVHVDWTLTPEMFYDFHNAYWQSRGQDDLLSKEFTIRVCNAAISRRQGFIIALRDEEEQLVAARFVIYDQECAYSLMSALNPKGHHRGASPMLLWQALKHLSGKTKIFDCEGSMDEGIEQSYRLYGTIQTPYFSIEKCNSRLFKLLKYIKERI